MKRSNNDGFTLIEAVVTVAVVVIGVQLVAGVTLSAFRSGNLGKERLNTFARSEQVAGRLAAEIRLCDPDLTDPLTGQPYAEVTGAPPSEKLTFRRVEGFVENGGEVVPFWSAPIELYLNQTDLVRKQSGTEVVLQRNVAALEFDIDSLSRIHLSLTTEVGDGHEAQDHVSQMVITPLKTE